VLVKVVFRQKDGKQVSLSAAQLRLTPKRGEAIEAVTEFDGSAFFLDVPAGEYQLELAPEQARRLRMRLVEPVTVIVSPDGGYVPDVTAQVTFAAPEEPAAQAALVEQP
jgi:hypothetical protein